MIVAPAGVAIGSVLPASVNVTLPATSSAVVVIPITDPMQPTPEGYVRVTFDQGANGTFAADVGSPKALLMVPPSTTY